MTGPQPLTFGDIDNTDLPLAVAVHGFPDTPHTWRHLGPELAERGYRVVAPWLPGHDRPADGLVNVGTYVRHILATRQKYGGDDRTLLVGHDWGAISAYGAVNTTPAAFARLVALAAPPMMVMTEGLFGYRQLKRSFYVWFSQLVGISEAVLAAPGFWESLWADWSPGYDATEDLAWLRENVGPESIAGLVGPYRASFNPEFNPDANDPEVAAASAAAMTDPIVPTLYLHGSVDGAMGAELMTDMASHLPAAGSDYQLLDGVGHFLHLEDPDLVWRRIKEWLP